MKKIDGRQNNGRPKRLNEEEKSIPIVIYESKIIVDRIGILKVKQKLKEYFKTLI